MWSASQLERAKKNREAAKRKLEAKRRLETNQVTPSKKKKKKMTTTTTTKNVEELPERIYVNRSPVMILWGAVCGQRAYNLNWEEAVSVSAAAASRIAKMKGASLGLMSGPPKAPSEGLGVLGVVVGTSCESEVDDVRGVDAEGKVVQPERAEAGLVRKFGENVYQPLKRAMARAAGTQVPEALRSGNGQLIYDLYCRFRPDVPKGRAGWAAGGSFVTANLLELIGENVHDDDDDDDKVVSSPPRQSLPSSSSTLAAGKKE